MPGLSDTAKLIASLELQDKFSGPARGIEGSLMRLDRASNQIGRGMRQVGTGLGQLATRGAIAAAAGLGAVITTAASFEQAFTGVEKTVEGTDAQLAELEKTLRQMARTIPVSFEELAGIGAAGGALGIAREDLDEFVDVVARLSVSTDLSADAAATALGQLANVLGLGGDELHDFADSLVALGNAGASTESQIVEIAARFGAAGRAAGLSKEDILALASTTASMGIEVEAAGGSLSRLFNQVATNIGTSNAKAKAFAKALGLSAADFRKAWEKDALGTFNEFLEKLNTLDQFEAAALLKKVGITGTRDINAVRTLAQGFDVLAKQIDISRGQTEELNEESQKFFDTTAGKWKILQGNVRDAAASIGTELLPVTNELIQDFVEFLGKPATQRGLASFAKDLAAGVRDLVDELRGTDFSGIIDGMKLAAQVAKGAFDAFRALPEPIQQLAIAALVANKLSGGAVGSIAAGLANIGLGTGGLLGRGSSPANPLWVQSVAGGVGGVPVVAGAGIAISTLLGVTSAVVLGQLIGEAIGKEFFFEPVVAPARTFETNQVERILNEPSDVASLTAQIAALDEGISNLEFTRLFPPGGPLGGLNPAPRVVQEEIELLQSQRDALQSLLGTARRTEADTGRWSGIFADEIAQRQTAQALLQTAIATLPFDIGSQFSRLPLPPLNVNVTMPPVSVSVSNVIRVINGVVSAAGSGPGGAVSNPY